MSSKFKKQQKKKRWSECGVVTTTSYAQQVYRLASDGTSSAELRSFGEQMQAFLGLRSTYAELESLKKIGPFVVACAETSTSQGAPPAQDVEAMLCTLGEVLFLENSRPLHRQLLALLRPLPPDHSATLGRFVCSRVAQLAWQYLPQGWPCQGQGGPDEGEIVGPALAGAGGSAMGDGGGGAGAGAGGPSSVPLGQALTSLLGIPSMRPFLAPSASRAVACVSLNIKAVLSGTAPGGAVGEADRAGMDGAGAGGGGGGEAGGMAALHIAPAIMEDVQDAVSALYYMLTGYGQELAGSEAGRQAVLLAADALLVALKGSVLAREALASAAVALYAAATLPAADPRRSALHFAEGLLLRAGEPSSLPPAVAHAAAAAAMQADGSGGPAAGAAGATAAATEGALGAPPSESRHRTAPKAQLLMEEGGEGPLEGPPLSLLDAQLRAQGSSLVQELQQLPAISRICALKGLLYSMPLEVCCTPLLLQQPPRQPGSRSGGFRQPWMLLTDGAIGELCQAVLTAPDAHFKFHAVRALSVCLERIKEALAAAAVDSGGGPGSSAAGSGKGGAPPPEGNEGEPAAVPEGLQGQQGPAAAAAAAAADGGAGWVLPVIGEGLRDQLKATLWTAWEEPLGQTVRQVHTAFGVLLDIMDIQAELAGRRQGAGAAGEAQGAPQAAGGDFVLTCAWELLAMDPARKSRYAPLATVAPRVGGAALLALQPDFAARALGAMEDHGICSAVAGALGALWGQLRMECEAAGGDDAGAGAWAGHWAPPMLAMLSSPSETVRNNVAAYALPALLQVDPGVMGHLLRELLGRMSGGGGDAEGAAAACVAVLKAGRQLQLLTDLHSAPVMGLGAAAVEAILQRTAVRASQSIRVDTLQLVCAHPKASALPTPLELRIASKFVGLTLRCASSSLRNAFLSLMAKLLARVRCGVAFVLGRPAHHQTPDQREGVALQQRWLQWLSNTLMASLYPGAPFVRTFMAAELINVVLETFGDAIVPEQPTPALGNGCEVQPLLLGSFSPFCPGFISESLVDLLLVAAVDTWDKLRESAFHAMMRLPKPLPGLEEGPRVEGLLDRALALVSSPRLGESDAGAKLVLLAFKKYVAALGWRISLQPSATGGAAAAAVEEPAASQEDAVLHFLEGACDLLQACIEGGKRDMLEACKTSLAHGPQITLRYLVGEVAWGQLAQDAKHAGRARALLGRLLALDYEAAALVLGPLCNPQEQNVGAGEVDADDVNLGAADMDADLPAEQPEGAATGTGLGPKAQVIMTGSWLTMKECSLLLGALARNVPLSGTEAAPPLLSVSQVKAMGEHFVSVLCLMRHNGAIDKTQAGFVALCERLLREPSPALNTLPQQWLSALLGFLQRPGQTRTDIVRRSAGLPLALKALFAAEPTNTHKILMKRGMDEMLRLAGSEERAEPWPRVHALNVLRVVFNDASLATDSSAYYARGLEVSLLAMAAPQWEVRNGATLCYTSLLVRILGFRNTASRDAASKRAVTVADFFAQYPALHPFLLGQLQLATEQLERGGERVMHPSLFPVLALLSRLRQSLQSCLSAHTARPSPAAFVPLVRRCAAADQLAVRQLAARALVPLLASAEVPDAIAGLAADVADAISGSASALGAQKQQERQEQQEQQERQERQEQQEQQERQERQEQQEQQEQQERSAGGVGVESSRPAANAVHGWLLQLRHLLESASSSEDIAADELAPGLDQVAAQLRRCVGVCALGQYRCAPLSLEYLKAIRALMALVSQPGHTAAQQVQRDLLRGVAQHCWAAISRSLAVEDGDSTNPMTSSSFKVATELYFGPLRDWMETNQEPSPSGLPLEGEVQLALHSLKYEVRSATLKQLVKQLGSQVQSQEQQQQQQQRGRAVSLPLSEPALRALRATLVRHLAAEAHHKGARRTLCLLSLLPPSLPPELGAPSPAAAGADGLFVEILGRAQQEADPAIRQYAVRCLGQLLGPVLAVAAAAALALAEPQQHDQQHDQQQAGEGLPAREAVRAFLALLQECGQPWQLPELRWAAVAALDSSGLLSLRPVAAPRNPLEPLVAAAAGPPARTLPDWLVEASLEGWEVAVKLLEEEETEIRDAMAAVAADAASASDGLMPSEGATASSASEAGAGLRQGWVEWVERGVFAALASRFGPHPALVSRLCSWVYALPEAAGPEGAPSGENSGAAASGRGPQQEGEEGNAVGGAAQDAAQDAAEERRLFDKELDNHHEEPLLIAQLAAEALARLASTLGPETKAGGHVISWATTALCQLEAAGSPAGAALHASGLLSHGAVIPWEQYGEVAGAVQDGFVPLYRMLLALWVAGHVGRRGGASASEHALAGSVGGDILWRQEMSTRLAALFGEGSSRGTAEDLVQEQPQLRSLIGKVLGLWGCRAGEAQPVFQAAFLAGRPPQF